MTLTELALARAGVDSLTEFQRANGLPPTGRENLLTTQKLLPYLTGCVQYSVQAGDTYTRIAPRYGTTVRAIITANPNQDPAALRVGQTITVPYGFEVVPTTVPFTYEVLCLCLQGLSARYPFLTVNAFDETAYGRKLYQIAVGLGSRKVLYNAAHHANEWLTTPLLLRFLEQYANAISEAGNIFGYSAQTLYQKTTLHLVPMVDPDGVDLVTGGLTPQEAGYAQAQAIAANYPAIPFPSGWKANLRGVDLNLNYPAGWEQARAIKYAQGYISPAPRDFVGFLPLDQPETAGLAALTRRLNPRLTLSYHAQGEVIYWKYLQMQPPEAKQIGEDFAAVSGYRLDEVPSASGYAGYKDWFVLTYNRPGYTVEVGKGTNPLPPAQLDEIYARNLGILTLGLNV